MRPRATILLPLALAGLLAISGVAEAKKGGKSFTEQKAVNLAIPDKPAGLPATPLVSEITVPKKFKGKAVGDVNVTNLQTSGSAVGATGQLAGYLTSPSGRTLELFYIISGGTSFGPWTLDDDTNVSICNSSTPCADPDAALLRPFAGTSNLLLNWAGAFPVNGSLAIFNGTKMRGTWQLTVTDFVSGTTSTLNQWGLKIKAAKPVAE